MTVTTGTEPDTVTTPVTEDRSYRERVIRDLYALAAFYVAHPDHPLPDRMTVSHHVYSTAEVERVAAEYAPETGTYARSACNGAQTDFTLEGPKMWINMITVCTGDDA